MVCTLPSARSLSKARSEGALRENMAKADMSASAQAISVSLTRSSGWLAQPLCPKRKSASAARCFRPCGATMDITPPDMRTSNRFCEGEIFALTFTKRQRECRGDYWAWSSSGNCCLCCITDLLAPLLQLYNALLQELVDQPCHGYLVSPGKPI